MEIKVERKWKKTAYTVGVMYVDGQRLCETLEDKDRGLTDSMTPEDISKIKVKGATAIPAGRYPVELTWSNRFKKKMPLVENVKGFSGIRIHSGNTADDTEGCILVGESKQRGMVLNSRKWYSELLTRIIKASSRGEKIFITVE